jgi:hypothetical protein
MRNFMWALLAIAALGFVLAACSTETTKDTGDEPKDEATPAEVKKVEPKADGPATGGPCVMYEKCCNDYADAIGKTDGMTEDIVKMTKDSCGAIESMKGVPGAAESCQAALDGMKAGAEAYKAMPGFVMPKSCE